MAERNVIMPGARTPVVDNRGRIDPVWYRFLVDLHERTGGGATDKVEDTTVVAEGAETAAATAQTSANTAQTAAATAQTAANAAQTAANTAQSSATTVSTDLTTLKGGVDGTTTTLGFYNTTPAAKPDITGSAGGNAALQDLITKLEGLGLLSDSTT